jgi:hypothetical protein
MTAVTLTKTAPPSLRALSLDAGTRTVWGVLSFSRALGRHVVDDCGSAEEAQVCLSLTRRRFDASALLVSRVEILGPWALTPQGVTR